MTKQTVDDLLAKGFGLPLYLTEIAAFAPQRDAFEQDLLQYYQALRNFLERIWQTYQDTLSYDFMLNLFPLAHHMDLWLHGDPKQVLYMTNQRIRPGGHINYRLLAWEANQLVAQADPYLTAICLEHKPDPTSREEFFDRS
ncbi:hypothetical protein [Ktedonobacter robiniae]|uniref:Uncharacterized protein n=1 Tax=Ktedonobacter robiniae TaxID=2778365 RepID=A0ABQ3V2S8_9CHLR|nr:hypothetical protein [Ktedonobacter robiniae]GHO59263.1 hypothetical protein KSB_77380 [Ktedonobacter robiniae]